MENGAISHAFGPEGVVGRQDNVNVVPVIGNQLAPSPVMDLDADASGFNVTLRAKVRGHPFSEGFRYLVDILSELLIPFGYSCSGQSSICAGRKVPTPRGEVARYLSLDFGVTINVGRGHEVSDFADSRSSMCHEINAMADRLFPSPISYA